MSDPTPADCLRVAVAICVLRQKPEGQAVESYALDLREWANGIDDSRLNDWRALAISLEAQLRDIRADELHRDKTVLKRGKHARPSSPPSVLPSLPPSTSDLPSILRRALSTSLRSPSKLDTLRTRIVPEMSWAFPEGLLTPALKSFITLSVEAFDSSNLDSRPSLLRLVQYALECVSSETRKEYGMLAINCLSPFPDVDRLAAKDARWYICSVISLCPVGQLGAEKLCKFLEIDKEISLIEKEMVEGILERIWLTMEDD